MDRKALIDLLVAWAPLIVLIGIGGWLMSRSMRSYNKHLDEVREINRESHEVTREAHRINREILEINRQTLAELREIKTALKDGKS